MEFNLVKQNALHLPTGLLEQTPSIIKPFISFVTVCAVDMNDTTTSDEVCYYFSK